MTIWIGRALALAIHNRQLAEHGGSSGVHDDNLLEAALVRPRTLHPCDGPRPDLADLAASLACELAHNRPFVDGNERSAVVICETFIELNEARLVAEDIELFAEFLALAEGQLSAEEFAAWLRPRIESAPRDQVQEPRPAHRRA